VLTTTLSTDERISAAHRAKLAFVYVRQSSPGQVRHHQESTELQYRLVERATLFGWPRERVHVIDDDLGKSGTSSSDRQGFQTLIAEVGLGKAGLVMSLDASRLARNNRDWHQLLELCSLFGVLIADGERLYDPAAYHDRLLLGLSGIMSEAELHQIKIRLHQGERQKAARGELRLPLPAGLIHNHDGGVTFNPDEEVQERLRLVFAKFRELRTAKAVVRYLRRGNLSVPVRPLHGPAPHDVVWRAANSARVVQILKNPAYAGAYVYGRRRPDPLRRQPGSERVGTVAVAPEETARTTGRQVLDQALAAGHEVTAVVRDPSKLSAPEVASADVMDPAAIAPFIDGRDVVVTAIGSRELRRPTSVQTDSTASIVEAMRLTDVRRLIVVSNSGMVTDGDGPLTKGLVKPILRRILVHGWTDMRHMEDVVTASGLDWTIIRPPRLTNRPATGRYRFAINNFLQNSLQISRADVAHFMIHHITDEATHKSTIEIAK